MSELIDSIFDVQKISKEIETITGQLESLKNEIGTFSESVKKMGDSIRGSKSGDDLAKNAKLLNDKMVEGQEVTALYIETQKQLEAQQKKLVQAQAKQAIATNDTAKEIIKLNLTAREQNELLKAEAVLNNKNAGTIEKLTAQNKILAIEKKKLNIETEAGKKRLIEINAQQDANNKLLNESSNQLEKQKVNVGNYKSAFGGLVTSFKNGEIGLKGLVNGFGKLAASILLNPVFLAVGAFVALGKVVKDSVNQAEEYQSANAELAGVLGITRDETKELQKESQRLGATTAFSALEVAKLQIEYARLGFSQKMIKDVTASTIDLSIAAKASADDTAAFLGAAINQFGLTSDEAQRIADVAAKGYSTTALNFEKLSMGFEKAAPAAKAFGDSVETTTAKLGVLANAGIGAEVSGTSLKAMYLSLAKSGMSWDDAMQQINTSTNKLATANKLFGKNFAVSALTLAENADQVKELAKTYEGAKGSAKALADEQLNTIEGSKKLLESTWSGFLFQIEDGNGVISNMWKGIIDGLSTALVWLTDTIASIKNGFTETYNASLPLRAVIETIKLLFKNAFEVIGTGFKEVGNYISGFASAFKAVITGDFKSLPGIIKETMTNAKDIAKDGAKDIGTNFAKAWETTKNGKIIAKETSEAVVNTTKKMTEEEIKLEEEKEEAKAELTKKQIEERKKAEKEAIASARRLIDSELAIMAEGEEKQLAIQAENFRRKIEDLRANGQLTAELEKNLTIANEQEVQKIKDDFAKKEEDKRKQDADKAASDFEKQIADYEKNLQREVAILNAAYNDKAVVLKRQFAAGKLSRVEYDKALAALQADAAKEANQKTIDLLQKELAIAEISADKKIEISDKIRELQIANENAALDATIEANDKKVEADKAAADKRKEIAGQLFDAGMDLFGAIGDFQAQQSEQRIAEIESEQEASDKYFTDRQANLDNAIMSEETRAAAQKKIDEDKAKRDQEIAEKIRAEKIKQAKWEKAQNLISAIVGTATATVGALGAQPWSAANFIFAALTAAAGAVQIATIASQKIPAFAKGTMDTGNTYALWGEERPEVAVTRTGDIMFAEKPTISHFDAGTRIFKSVEDFERNMSATGTGAHFEIDYDKMADAMPETTINLDSNGLWSVMNKQQNRAILINRRYKIGR